MSAKRQSDLIVAFHIRINAGRKIWYVREMGGYFQVKPESLQLRLIGPRLMPPVESPIAHPRPGK
jgi:hypothetical protein